MNDDNEKVIGVIREQGIDYDTDGEAIPWTEVYVKIKVAFRQRALKLLKGPKLSCFLCVALHVGEKGTAHPSIDTIMRETGYSRSVVCNALGKLENLGFIEKQRRKHDSTLYHVRGYVWFGSESKPTLLGESRSSKNELSESKSRGGKRLPTKRLLNEPKDDPCSKDKPITAKDNLDSGSKKSMVVRLNYEKAKPHVITPDEVDQSLIESIADDFLNNPSPEDLQRQTIEAQEPNYATPHAAGGDGTLLDRLCTVFAGCLGLAEPEDKERKQWGRAFEKSLRKKKVTDPNLTEDALRVVLNPLDKRFNWFTFTTPHDGQFQKFFEMALGKAKKRAADVGAVRAEAIARNEEAQAALDARPETPPPKPIKEWDVWDQAKAELERQMVKHTFDTYVKPVHLANHEDGVVVLAAPNAFTRDWIENRLKRTIERALVGVVGEAVEMRVEVGDDQ